ncbi:MAG: AAA family ATPase [Bryobacteraceae bacterium]
MTPVGRGDNIVDFCFEHFEPQGRDIAFTLHVLGLSPEDQTAAFALVPVDSPQRALGFTARWGRTGVGPANFMPVPQQVEDDRPAVEIYGFKTSNFNWRSSQWEIASVGEPRSYDVPSLMGEALQIPSNSDAAWAFRDGLPVANVDELGWGSYPELGIEKTKEESGHSFLVHFGGRIWRRWIDGPKDLELLAFDPDSPVLQSALDRVWADIGGQEEAKRELIRAIQWPVLYPELFLLFKRRRSRGVLLYGPPGCGKTLLGKAVVKLLAALYNRRPDDGGFKYVKGHQLLDMYVGQSEKAVKSLFDEARRFRDDKGYPAVLFFDEADALFRRRAPGSAESGFTLVPALLAEMDGLDDNGAFVMLATNRADALDVAITRPGRIDRRIRITRPDEAASRKIFSIHLDGVFLAESIADLSAYAAAELTSENYPLYEVQFDEGPDAVLHLKHLSSGALIQNIVDRATANKMEYCIEHGVKAGLDRDDLRTAIEEVLAEQRQARHVEELDEFAELLGRHVAGARKVSV